MYASSVTGIEDERIKGCTIQVCSHVLCQRLLAVSRDLIRQWYSHDSARDEKAKWASSVTGTMTMPLWIVPFSTEAVIVPPMSA